MSAVQISEDLRQLIDRQVAEGRAANATEFLEAAARLYLDELEADGTALAAAAEQGLAALAKGDFTEIDSPRSRQSFWEGVREDANLRVAILRTTVAADDAERDLPRAGSDLK